MSTTIMRNSKIGDAWIMQAMQNCPISYVKDANGQPTANILTGPVRLAFVDLLKPGKAMDAGKEGKFGTQILFPPRADMTLFMQEHHKVASAMFPEYFDQATQQFHGLHSPFRDQAEKLRFGGYTPGCVFMTCTSKFKPPVVDARMNPIVDESKIYAGVWAILSVNAYGYGKNPPQPKKGVAFGIQSVMIIADDEKFGGGAPDAKSQFGGVNITPPASAPSAMFGQPQAAPMANPNAGFMTPAHSAMQPQQQWAPPAAAPVAADEDMSWMG